MSSLFRRAALVGFPHGLCRNGAGARGRGPGRADEEILARTVFTDRIENFFEYSPLRSGEPSPFLIHLTDLQDGSPVAEAEVELSVRRSNGEEVVSTRAEIGRVTGIYVVELEVSLPGTYEIEFHVRNAILDETMLLAGFLVQ